jgi:hypothetical protein
LSVLDPLSKLDFQVNELLPLKRVRRRVLRPREGKLQFAVKVPPKCRQALEAIHHNDPAIACLRDVKDWEGYTHETGLD